MELAGRTERGERRFRRARASWARLLLSRSAIVVWSTLVATAAMVPIAPARADDALDREAALLERGNEENRLAAVMRLGTWRGAPLAADSGPREASGRVQHLLLRALGDAAPSVRAAAAGALAERGARGALESLRRALGVEQDVGVLPAVILAIGALGTFEDGSRLNPFALHREPNVRRAAVLALGDLAAPDALRVALHLAEDPRGPDPHDAVRAAAITTIGKVGRAEDVDALLRWLGPRGEATRVRIDEGSGWLVRSAIAEALGRLGRERADVGHTLTSLLSDPDGRVGVAAGAALARLGRRQDVLRALAHPTPRVRAAAIAGVHQGRLVEAHGILRAMAMRDADREVRFAAASTLFQADVPEADAWMLDAVGAEDPGVAIAARELLVARLGVDRGRDVAAWRVLLETWRRR